VFSHITTPSQLLIGAGALIALAGPPAIAQVVDTTYDGFVGTSLNDASNKKNASFRLQFKPGATNAIVCIEEQGPGYSPIFARGMLDNSKQDVLTGALERSDGTQLGILALSKHEIIERDVKNYRVRVDSVEPRSAAEAAGLKPGDIILSINAKPIDSFAEVQRVAHASVGETLRIVVDRGGHEVTLTALPRLQGVRDNSGKVRKIGVLGIHRSNHDAVEEMMAEAKKKKKENINTYAWEGTIGPPLNQKVRIVYDVYKNPAEEPLHKSSSIIELSPVGFESKHRLQRVSPDDLDNDLLVTKKFKNGPSYIPRELFCTLILVLKLF
jgi:membrane-associated protease RseP (regulator of RpoE activity)